MFSPRRHEGHEEKIKDLKIATEDTESHREKLKDKNKMCKLLQKTLDIVGYLLFSIKGGTFNADMKS